MSSAYLYLGADCLKDVTIRVRAIGTQAGSAIDCTLTRSDGKQENRGPAPEVSFPITSAELQARFNWTLQATVAALGSATTLKLAVLQGEKSLDGFVKPDNGPRSPIVKDPHGDTDADTGLNSGDQPFHPLGIDCA